MKKYEMVILVIVLLLLGAWLSDSINISVSASIDLLKLKQYIIQVLNEILIAITGGCLVKTHYHHKED